MIMSQSIASSLPPPRAKPVTAAISGLVTLRMCSHCWKRYSWSMSTAEASANSRMSAPAGKAGERPARTTLRISSSRSKSSSTVTSSSISARFKALRTSGRFNCTTAIASSRVTTRCCQVMGSPPFDLRRRLIRPPERAAAVAAVGELLGDVRGPAVGAALRGRAPGELGGPVFTQRAADGLVVDRPLFHERFDSLPRLRRARLQGQPARGWRRGPPLEGKEHPPPPPLTHHDRQPLRRAGRGHAAARRPDVPERDVLRRYRKVAGQGELVAPASTNIPIPCQ